MTADQALSLLPQRFADWFVQRGWHPRAHQLAMIEAARAGEDALLIAPTGGGKTLGGFLPSLIDLAQQAESFNGVSRPYRLHTLYISPLKALSVDVARNLMTPVEEMGLDLRIETRTGDTSPAKRQRQRAQPPDILLTTPEQLALFMAQDNCAGFFADLRCVIVDEIHALAPQKRGDLLNLGLASLARYAPLMRRVGLSATVKDVMGHARWLTLQSGGEPRFARIIEGQAGKPSEVEILASESRIPWSGHSGRHAMEDVYQAIKSARLSLIFVNTRSQAEFTFQQLWALNEDHLAIALHHGSLSPEQRRKVEAAMARGALKAVVCTSTLDLGIDWGDVDLVIQLGAPKGTSRLIQRLGRSNHRLDEASRAVLVPTNRFEHLECAAARAAVHEGVMDGDPLAAGHLDVLAQHIMGRACGDPYDLDDLYREITGAAPYAHLSRSDFDRIHQFVVDGGYALDHYDRFRRLVKTRDGLWRPRSREVITRHRMNVGAIIEAAQLHVRLSKVINPNKDHPQIRAVGGASLGQIEEWFVDQLSPKDTFLFGGQVLRFEGVSGADCLVTRARDETPKIPAYNGGKFPYSTYLAERVRDLVHREDLWGQLPDQIREWLSIQKQKSRLPQPGRLLVETFPRAGKFYLVCYPFEGRLAHQSLGMLLTRRLERARMRPLGFVANEYALSIWGLRDMADLDMAALFDSDMLGDDLEAWLDESALMKRTFRNCALISGLIERRVPGLEKTGRQVTFSADLIYDVLRQHEPDHILLQAAWQDAATGLLDIRRLSDWLSRIQNHVDVERLTRISPLAVPVMLEVGREPVYGEAHDAILEDAADTDLIEEAMG
ncbi:ligase-associated DNA damage response DEXH box helicase [Woodsholea maritima]|uniref:ligase-associated DNA damage response DEXH box helicase n=1 Tax=Woodsholea maritima TaxID=240237 RepID=UPI000370CE50|nr:ligase-associated DNA damage response DEXH box helicase [Woodsholea maritima]